MTPHEIQRTMDFILRSQADSVIRMERLAERSAKQQDQIDDLIVAVRNVTADVNKLVKENRAHEKQLRALEKSKYRTENHLEGLRDVVKILARLTAAHSKRLEQLESPEI